ncbi:bacteriophage holin [Actinokineospora sp. 24-640]
MPFLLSAAVLVVLVLFAVVGVGVLRRAGRARAALGAVSSGLADRSGLLRARAAALRVAIGDRKMSAGHVESMQRGETGGRP